jgi:hypothetical protein
MHYTSLVTSIHPMLTGTELLNRVEEIKESSKTKSDTVRACGYVSVKKDGTERLNFTAFYAALLDARGIKVANDGAEGLRAGRRLSFRCKVQFNGNLLIGKSYGELLGVKPGDEFQIWLSSEGARLTPVDPAVMNDCALGDEWITAEALDTDVDADAEGDEGEGEGEEESEDEDSESHAEDLAACAAPGLTAEPAYA